jgi:hypothetical protein
MLTRDLLTATLLGGTWALVARRLSRRFRVRRESFYASSAIEIVQLVALLSMIEVAPNLTFLS